MTVGVACITCGYLFRCDPDTYTARGLAPPKRCPHCRAQRKATRPRPSSRQIGTVAFISAAGHFGFLDAGPQRYFFTQPDVAAGDVLVLGAGVTFEAGDDPHVPGRRPRARVVCLLKSDAVTSRF